MMNEREKQIVISFLMGGTLLLTYIMCSIITYRYNVNVESFELNLYVYYGIITPVTMFMFLPLIFFKIRDSTTIQKIKLKKALKKNPEDEMNRLFLKWQRRPEKMMEIHEKLEEEKYWEEERDFYTDHELVKKIPDNLFKGENIDENIENDFLK